MTTETARAELRWVRYQNPPPSLAEVEAYSRQTGIP